MTPPQKDPEKRPDSISVRVSPTIKKRLQEWESVGARSMSDYAHTLLEEAFEARSQDDGLGRPQASAPVTSPEVTVKLDQILTILHSTESGSRGGSDSPASDPVVHERLDHLLKAVEELGEKTALLLEPLATERTALAEELESLRAAIAVALVNVLMQVNGVDREKAWGIVRPALNPPGRKPLG